MKGEPMTLAASLNKSTYAPGETMTLTVTTTAAERDQDVPVTVTVSVEGLGDATATAVIDKAPAAITVTDPNRTWAQTSDDGTTAVYTATA